MGGRRHEPPEHHGKHSDAAQLFPNMKVTFYDMEILVDREKPEAQATFTAVFEGDPSSGRPVRETKEMDAGLVRKQDRWLLTSLAFRDVIRK